MQNIVSFISPEPLHPGDKVAIVATARKVSPEEMAPAITLFQSWGLEVVLPRNLYAADNQFAGSDIQRAESFQWALDDPSIKAVFCARGGYGSARMIDKVDFSSLRTHPKWIVGYSDVTVIHSHIHSLVGIESLHATMPINISPTDLTTPSPAVQSLKKALFFGLEQYDFPSHALNRHGDTIGPLVGGNLSILYSLIGTPSDLDTDGKILFIEDLDEYLYHIDRMMMNLKRAGKLANLRGLIVGAMSDMHDNAIPFGKSAEEIVWDSVKDYSYPVCMAAPFGHIGGLNNALPLGKIVKLTVADNTSISFKN